MAPKRTRTVGSSSTASDTHSYEEEASEIPHLPPRFYRNDEQRERNEVLRFRTIHPTRYLDFPFIRKLGLRADINFMLTNIGWTTFATMHNDVVYPRLVLEFLSSLHTEILSGPNCSEGLISFRMFNQEHELTLAQFNNIFGFPTGGSTRTPSSFNPGSFWYSLTGTSNWVAGKCNSSAFRHPAIRIMHRFIASTVLARGDSEGKVRLSDLLLLWAMMENREEPIDSGSHLARQFQSISNTSHGAIVNGGLITTIAKHLGYHAWLDQLEPLPGSRTINFATCSSMNCIAKDEDDKYYFVVTQSGVHHQLPNPTYTVKNRATRQFPLEPLEDLPPAAEEAAPADEEAAPEQPPLHPGPEVDNAAILAAIQSMDNRLKQMDERQQHYNYMVDQMYQWHIQRYPDDFPPQ